MGAAVLLEHRLADGSWHYDWMVERGDGATWPHGRMATSEGKPTATQVGLITFRVSVRIDAAEVSGFEAEQLADHRREYLEFEGEVSGGRGTVRRVARGELRVMRDDGEEFVCEGVIGANRGRFEGRRNERGHWKFLVRPSDS